MEIEKSFREMIERVKNAICSRCGRCCYSFTVKLPDGTIKPEQSNCPYLIPARIENGKWKMAECKIYKMRPKECELFIVLGKEGICELGKEIWKERKEKYPNVALPEEIAAYVSS